MPKHHFRSNKPFKITFVRNVVQTLDLHVDGADLTQAKTKAWEMLLADDLPNKLPWSNSSNSSPVSAITVNSAMELRDSIPIDIRLS
jgi:hypothetical protein